MLQVAVSFQARRSPCYDCPSMGQANYPACQDGCREVEDYMAFLGDPFKLPPPPIDLEIYGPQKASYAVDYSHRTCTEEQGQMVKQWLTDAMAKGQTIKGFGRAAGVGETTLGKLKRGEITRISTKNFGKIERYMRGCK